MIGRAGLACLLLCGLAWAQADFVDQVHAAASRGDYAGADRMVDAYRKQHGDVATVALAVSWEGRAALAAKQYDRAATYADWTHKLAGQLLKTRRLDAEPELPLALGASIEVHAQAMAAQGEISSAVGYLQTELQTYARTSIVERISKNINLLSLKGKPAPPLTASEWIGTKPPSLADLKGKPVLVFFWAHWCPDCKEQAPLLGSLAQRYASKGLVVLAPTRYYGYVEAGKDASPKEEKRYIESIRNRYYSMLSAAPVPVSNSIFETYGCSSTPTLALIDKKGIVHWYHPGTATEAELVREIEAVL